jgi:hypothetical protein
MHSFVPATDKKFVHALTTKGDGLPVQERDLPVRTAIPDNDWARIGYVSEPLLAFAQSLLRHPALRKILHDSVVIQHPAVSRPDRLGAFANENHRAIPPGPCDLEAGDHILRLQQLAEGGAGITRLEPFLLKIALAQLFERAVPEEAEQSRIDHEDTAIGCGAVDPHGGVFE